MNANAQTLTLSREFAPVGVVPWQQALTMVFLGKAEVIEEYDDEVRSTYLVVKIPAVVRLLSGFKRRSKSVKFSRINVYGRDDFRCLYCGARKSVNDLTYDHVLPRSRGGKTEWLNIATCCSSCNARKANRTPEQAGMKLRKPLTQPTRVPVAMIPISRESAPAAWRDYLYWTGELDEG